MSTKVSIKSRAPSVGLAGFHLYYDVLDSHDLDVETAPTVYLRLDGVAVQLRTLNGVGASVTVEVPWEVAVGLGVVSAAQVKLKNPDELGNPPSRKTP